MPCPVTHIAHAIAYHETRKLAERKLVRGVTFPDIRRTAGIDRGLTHASAATMKDVNKISGDPWKVGWWLHSYLDLAWNQWFRDRGLTESPTMHEAKWRALKLAEELIIIEELPNREKLAGHLEGPFEPTEMLTPARPDQIKTWYSYVAWRLREPYDPEAWCRRVEMISDSTAEEAREIVGQVDEFLADKVWMGYLKELRRDLGY